MITAKEHLELRILDCAPEGVGELVSCCVGPGGPGGRNLLFVGGDGAVLWYDPENGERGFVDDNIRCGVGLVLEDVDGDGTCELFVSDMDAGSGKGNQAISMYKAQARGWSKHVIADKLPGQAHDIVFGDIDGDGVREIVTIACYSATPGVFLLRPEAYEGTLPVKWSQTVVCEEVFAEGVSLGDIDGDGRMEIVCGPDWYEQPDNGPYSGPWVRRTYAPTYREMCRTALVDITGNGTPDIVITDSEYMDGTLSWYENRLGHPGAQWVEHRLNDHLVYSHSLDARRRADGVDIFVAEMEQGGWDPPYNHDARLLLYSSSDNGVSWTERELYHGEGTHEAQIVFGKNGITVFGKTLGRYWKNPRVQVWSEAGVLSHLHFTHTLIDRGKPGPGTDILAFRPDGGERRAIACGRWVYMADSWERREVEGISQIINAHDVDGDGSEELIATTLAPPSANGLVSAFNNELVWMKPTDATCSAWTLHPIATGCGDWPHGSLVAPVLPGGGEALLLAYHSVNGGKPDFPQIVPLPEGAGNEPWKISTLSEIMYGEQLLAADVNGNGLTDIVAGSYWLRNDGDGSFTPFQIVSDFMAARVAVADIAGNGRPDVMLVEEAVDYEKNIASFVRVAWFECPDDPEDVPWKMHMIDSLRSPHNLSTGDIDGDGIPEFIIAEHDPFWPYRSRNRMFVYKSLDHGVTWFRRTIDSRFEHHDGAKLADLGNGRQVILSHGWRDSVYVHLWDLEAEA
jgi:hypothetical protein